MQTKGSPRGSGGTGTPRALGMELCVGFCIRLGTQHCAELPGTPGSLLHAGAAPPLLKDGPPSTCAQAAVPHWGLQGETTSF